MSAAAKPLELPLRANPPTLVFGWEIMDAKGTLVAMMQRHPGMRAEAQAYCEFLVMAGNNHEALVSALSELQANPNDPRAHRQAMDALKQAALPPILRKQAG